MRPVKIACPTCEVTPTVPISLQNPNPAADGGGDAGAPSDPPVGPEDSGPPVPPNAQNGIGVEQNENGFRFV